MNKKHQLHLLPTDKEGIIMKGVDVSGKAPLMLYNDVWSDSEWQRFGTPQHLYFTSDEEIKEGEWGILQAFDEPKVKKAWDNSNSGLYKKIVATTDPKLWNTIQEYSKHKMLSTGEAKMMEGIPKISHLFVKEYVEKPVKEVNLEYEDYFDGDTIAYQKNGYKPNSIRLKLDSNGCVIVSNIVEETWGTVWSSYVKYKESYGQVYVGQFLEWLKENYHPPKIK